MTPASDTLVNSLDIRDFKTWHGRIQWGAGTLGVLFRGIVIGRDTFGGGSARQGHEED